MRRGDIGTTEPTRSFPLNGNIDIILKHIMSDQIVFTGERRVFFSRKTSKAPESQGEIPASEATKNDKPAELP